MKIFVATHDEAGVVMVAKSVEELTDKLCDMLEYVTATVDGDQITCDCGMDCEVIYILTEWEV